MSTSRERIAAVFARALRRERYSLLLWRAIEIVAVIGVVGGTVYYSWYWSWAGFVYAVVSAVAGLFLAEVYGDLIFPGLSRRRRDDS